MSPSQATICNFTMCDTKLCGQTGTDDQCYVCPEGCQCMTADNATALGYNINVKCSGCPCGTDSTSGLPMFCYGEKLYEECTTCGTCLPDSSVTSSCNFTQCDTTPCAPPPPSQELQHCYTCPEGCECLTSDNATNLINCSPSCKCSRPSEPDKYCYRPCPSECPCLQNQYAESENLTKCEGDLSCQCPLGTPSPKCYCYHECPDGCSCLEDSQVQSGDYIQCNTRVCGVTAGGQEKHCYMLSGGKSLPSGGCCANGRVSQATQSQCVQIGGQWYPSVTAATQACQPPPCWCCANGKVYQATQSQCAQMGGNCYNNQSQAIQACQPPPCWCCANGKVYQATQSQCAQMGGACYNDQSQATKACQQAPIPPLDTR